MFFNNIRRIRFGLLFFFSFNSIAYAGYFGPREHAIYFDGRKDSAFYRIDNVGEEKAWLAQVWVEDENGKKTDSIVSIPPVFRIDSNSVFSVRLLKKKPLPDDRETLFWSVSHSLPAGNKNNSKITDKVNAHINMAYRFKTPLIYRPQSLINKKSQPHLLQWTIDDNGKLKVYNPTPHIIHLHNVKINNKEYKGHGISLLLLPMRKSIVNIKVDNVRDIQYGVKNDYGSIKEYNGKIT